MKMALATVYYVYLSSASYCSSVYVYICMYHRLKIVYDVMNAQVCMCMCVCVWVFGWPWIGFGMFNVLVRVSVCVREERMCLGECVE